MIDTIRFKLRTNDSSVIKNMIGLLEGSHNVDNGDPSEYYYGNYGDFRVKVRVNSGKMTFSGSLSKYFKGSNIYDMTRAEIKEACDNLSQEIGCDVSQAVITRMDIGTNIILDNPVSNYLLTLNTMVGVEGSEYKRLETTEETVEYRSNNNEKTYVFYDKTKQKIDTKKPIPNEFVGKNILRYELRFFSRIRDKLNNGNPVLFADLYNKDFYNKLLILYVDQYNSIPKGTKLIIDPLSYNNLTPSKLIKYLAAIGLDVVGYNLLTNQLDSNKEVIGTTNFNRYGKVLRRIVEDKRFFMNDSHVEEMDAKINDLILKIEL